ncbi:MAG TPA: PepSY domain-containing protein [Gemmatimonadales bacterium]|nr:PepSY domain-containing protein [Gemmatimonadales bacterium]
MQSVSLMAAALALIAAGGAPAQQPGPGRNPAAGYQREVPAALLRQAKVSEDSALKVAAARIPGGKVQAVELENEHGKLIWSWEFTLAGRPGVYECNVSALDGTIVGVEHEHPRAEHHDTTGARPRP